MTSEGRPIAWQALEPGGEVICAGGERVGTVEHVLGDTAADIFDGLVVDVRVGAGGLRFVDAPEVAEIRERAVRISIGADALDRLPEPAPNPAVMASHGGEGGPPGELRRKLQRAWDLISGRG
jgi:hypothetical protein